MSVTVDLLGGGVNVQTMEPVWKVQRPFTLAWLEVTIADTNNTASSRDGTLDNSLTVQMWNRRSPGLPWFAVAEVILPAGDARAVQPQLLSAYGFDWPVTLAAGSENRVVLHTNGSIWSDLTFTVTPHGTFI